MQTTPPRVEANSYQGQEIITLMEAKRGWLDEALKPREGNTFGEFEKEAVLVFLDDGQNHVILPAVEGKFEHEIIVRKYVDVFKFIDDQPRSLIPIDRFIPLAEGKSSALLVQTPPQQKDEPGPSNKPDITGPTPHSDEYAAARGILADFYAVDLNNQGDVRTKLLAGGLSEAARELYANEWSTAGKKALAKRFPPGINEFADVVKHVAKVMGHAPTPELAENIASRCCLGKSNFKVERRKDGSAWLKIQ
jgi:hypothetical protein